MIKSKLRNVLVLALGTITGFSLSTVTPAPRPAYAMNAYCCNGDPILDDNSECEGKGGVAVGNSCSGSPDNGGSGPDAPGVIDAREASACFGILEGASRQCAWLPPQPKAACMSIAWTAYLACLAATAVVD